MTTPPPWAPRPGSNLGATTSGARQRQRQQQDQQRRRREAQEQEDMTQQQDPVERVQEQQAARREAMTQRSQPRADVPRIGASLGARPAGAPPQRRDTPTQRELVERVREGREAAAQERFQQAEEALGGRSAIQFLQEGGEPEQLVTVGYNRDDVRAIQAVAPFVNGDQRTVDVVGYLESGGDPDVLSRVVPEATVRAAQQRQADIEALEPFTDSEGRIDVLRAREEIGAPALERVLRPEDLQAAEALQADLATVEPFTVEDDQIDVVAALDAGVPQEVLDRLGVDVAPLRQQQADLEAIQPFQSPDGRVDLRAAIGAGVDEATLGRLFSAEDLEAASEPLGFEPLAAPQVDTPAFVPRDPLQDPQTRFERDAARLNELEALTDYQHALRNVVGATGRPTDAQIRQARDIVNRAIEERVRIVNRYEMQPGAIIQAAREGAELPPIGAGVSNIPTAAERQRMEAQITLEDPQASQLQRLQARQQLGTLPEAGSAEFVRQLEQEGFTSQEIAALSTGDFVQQQAIQAARAGDTQRLVDLGLSGEQITALTRREDVLARVGPQGENAVEALREGRVTEADLAQVFTQEDVQSIRQAAERPQFFGIDPSTLRPVNAEQRQVFALTPVPEGEGFDLSPRLPVEVQERNRVINAVQELGPQQAVQQGRATAAEVTAVFGPDVFQARPEEELAISPTRTLPIRADEALTELGRMGLAGPDGVLVADAALSGQEGLLLQAGFTQGQIDQAVSQRITPTAEPRLRPAPGETLPVDEEITGRLQELRQRQEAFQEQSAGFAGLSPTGATITAESITPEFQALERQIALVRDLQSAVEAGDLTNEEAQVVLREIPEEPTERDIITARRNLGQQLQIQGGLPVIGLPLSATGTALTFAEDSPFQRGLNIGLDAVSLVPLAGVAAGGARTAGAARGLTRVGQISSELAAAEMTPFFMNPRQLIRRTITDPVEVVVRPSRTVGLEETFTTLRVPAERGARLDPTIAPEPAETVRQIRAGELTGSDMKDAINAASIRVMRTGETATAPVGDTGTSVTVRAGAAHQTLGGAAFHATPDGRNILAGPITVSGREGGLFVAPTPMTRFSQAAAFGGDVPLTPQARAAVEAGQLSADPIPTVIMIRDPALLSQLRGPTDPTGAPKVFRHLAEVEALLPNGAVIPQASQVRMMRGASGERVALAVIGEPLTAGQQARLRVRGLAQAARNIFQPGAIVNFEGAPQARTALKGEFIADSSAGLLDEARALRTAGRVEDAVQLENAARRVTQRSEALSGAAGVRAPADIGTDGGRDGVPRDTAVLARDPGRDRIVPDRIDSLGADAPRETLDRRLTAGESSQRISSLSQLAGAADTRALTPAERQQAQRLVSDLGRADLTPTQRAQVDADVQRVRAQAPEVPRVTTALEPPLAPEAPRVTTTPEPPRTPRTPEPPRAPSITEPPRSPRVPDIPRVPGVPDVPTTPPPERPRPTPGIPEPDGPEGDDSIQRTQHVRVVGIARGAVGDTVVDLVSGDAQTVRDHPDVPGPGPTSPSFRVLSTSAEESGPQRLPWGALDLIVWPDGRKQWIEAGNPLPPDPPAPELGGNTPRSRGPSGRGGSRGRRRGGLA